MASSGRRRRPPRNPVLDDLKKISIPYAKISQDLLPATSQLSHLKIRSAVLDEALLGQTKMAPALTAFQKYESPLKRLIADSAGARLTLEQTRPLTGMAIDQSLVTGLGERLSQLYGSLATPQIEANKFLKQWGSISESWRPMVESFVEGMSDFIEAQREMDERTNEFVRKHGWPVPLRLDPSLYSRIVGMADRAKREVNAAMREGFRPGTRAYKATRDVLMDSDAFESRRPLLSQAFKAHKREEWYLVINSLLPLVEGAFVDVAFADQTPPEKGRLHQSVNVLKQAEDDSPIVVAAPIEAAETLLISAGAGSAWFQHFDPADYGGPGEPRALNRHAILHGAARRYGSGQNALKLYLLLVMLAEYFDFYEEAKQRREKREVAGD